MRYNADVFYRTLLNAYEDNGFARCSTATDNWQSGYHKSYKCTAEADVQWRFARGRVLNQFPFGRALSLKDLLALRLSAMARVRGRAARFHDVCPETFVLPEQLAEFRARVARAADTTLWISKPYSRSKGKGIRLWRGSAQLSELCDAVECSVAQLRDRCAALGGSATTPPQKEARGSGRGADDGLALGLDEQRRKMAEHSAFTPQLVVQHYIAHPVLVDGLKFDLRLYVALTSVAPLCLYIFPEGLARFCTAPYEAGLRAFDRDGAPLSNSDATMMAHLTNSSLNVQSDKYARNVGVSAAEMATGSKRSLGSVFASLEKDGVDTRALWREIGDVVKRAFVAFEPGLVAECRRLGIAGGGAGGGGGGGGGAYMLFGADVILEARAADVDGEAAPRPVLLEINCMPQIDAAMPIDKLIKGTMLCDLLHLVGHGLTPPLAARYIERRGLAPSERVAFDREIAEPLKCPVVAVAAPPLPLRGAPGAMPPMPVMPAMPPMPAMPALPKPPTEMTGAAADREAPVAMEARSYRALSAALTAAELCEFESGGRSVLHFFCLLPLFALLIILFARFRSGGENESGSAEEAAANRSECDAFVAALCEEQRRIGHWHRICPQPSTCDADAELFSTGAARRRYRALSRAFASAGVDDADLAPAHTLGAPLGSICVPE
jgi:hypothetical protein